MANILKLEKQVAAISMLAEGSSVRSTERVTGIHRDTIIRLMQRGKGVKSALGSLRLIREKVEGSGSGFLILRFFLARSTSILEMETRRFERRGQRRGRRGQIRSWLFTVDSGKGRFRRRESLFGSAANNPERKAHLEREIEATDRQIDQLVYELCGLMEDRSELTAKPGI
jgi:hypothetical protein